MSRRSSCNLDLTMGSRAASGSSRRSSSGSSNRARISPTLWRWPPDSSAGYRERASRGNRVSAESSSRRDRQLRLAPAEVAAEQQDVVPRRQVGKEAPVLHDVSDPAANGERVPGRDRLAAEQNVSFGRRDETEDEAQDRRLAGAARTDQRDRLAGKHPELHSRESVRAMRNSCELRAARPAARRGKRSLRRQVVIIKKSAGSWHPALGERVERSATSAGGELRRRRRPREGRRAREAEDRWRSSAARSARAPVRGAGALFSAIGSGAGAGAGASATSVVFVSVCIGVCVTVPTFSATHVALPLVNFSPHSSPG